MASGKRFDGEDFSDYRDRLSKNEKEIKEKLKGTIFWDGERGIYIKRRVQ